MNIISKSIIILFLFLNSCNRYFIGKIEIDNPNPTKIDNFNYVIFNDSVKMKGKVGTEIFIGEIYTTDVVRKVEASRNPQIKQKFIDSHNHFAFTRMIGSEDGVIECFIKQKSVKHFRAGGKGRCYIVNDQSFFDITLKKEGPNFPILKNY